MRRLPRETGIQNGSPLRRPPQKRACTKCRPTLSRARPPGHRGEKERCRGQRSGRSFDGKIRTPLPPETGSAHGLSQCQYYWHCRGAAFCYPMPSVAGSARVVATATASSTRRSIGRAILRRFKPLESASWTTYACKTGRPAHLCRGRVVNHLATALASPLSARHPTGLYRRPRAPRAPSR